MKHRYDWNLKEFVPVDPPRRSDGRFGIKVDRSGQFASMALGKNSPWATRHDARGRPVFLTKQAKRDAVLKAADHGEKLFLAEDVY